MVVVFLINVYLGLADTNLSSFNTAHYYANWVIALVSLVAAVLLLWKPLSTSLVAISGIVWPIVYVAALGGDVYTKLCTGTSSANCWPSKTAAFDYLILNSPNVPGPAGYGWKLAPVMPIAIALLAIVFVLSVAAIMMSRRAAKTQVPPAASNPPVAGTQA